MKKTRRTGFPQKALDHQNRLTFQIVFAHGFPDPFTHPQRIQDITVVKGSHNKQVKQVFSGSSTCFNRLGVYICCPRGSSFCELKGWSVQGSSLLTLKLLSSSEYAFWGGSSEASVLLWTSLLQLMLSSLCQDCCLCSLRGGALQRANDDKWVFQIFWS